MYRCTDVFSIVMASGGTFLEAAQPGGEMYLGCESVPGAALEQSEGSSSCFGSHDSKLQD